MNEDMNFKLITDKVCCSFSGGRYFTGDAAGRPQNYKVP